MNIRRQIFKKLHAIDGVFQGAMKLLVIICYFLIPNSHANCEGGGENKHNGRDMEDNWLSNNEVEDSDMDKNYVPNSDVSSSDSDVFNPSSSYQRRKKWQLKSRQKTIGVLENDLHHTSDAE
ncbi:hypothetical protein AVEN_171372-1 [Araneus ventricosus]|uniref:Uncharacterized protein n=1 Tax=Araneus ventricosus TaxID=182803 RepID=A0A4Y2F1A3_ARAVE|nr:hypothetical protein AVEN_171372-1 [Araneus ventricosus]